MSDSWILLGDLNREASQSDAIANAIDMGRACSALIGFCGVEHDVTCTRGAGSCIDHVFVAPMLWPRIQKAFVDCCTYFPSHRAVVATLNIGNPMEHCLLTLPTVLDEAVLSQIPIMQHANGPERIYDLVEDDQLDNAYFAWGHRWEEHLLQHASRLGARITTHSYGRGGDQAIQHRPLRTPHARPRQSLRTRRLGNLLAHLVNANVILANDEFLNHALVTEIDRLWRLVDGDEHVLRMYDFAQLQDMARHMHDESHQNDLRRHQAAWRERCTQLADPKCSSSFAYLRGARQLANACLLDQNNQPCRLPEEQLRTFAQFWESVAAIPPNAQAGRQGFLTYLHQEVPNADIPIWHRPPLQAKALQQAICKAKSHAAAGLDGWRVLELRRLPLAAYEELACIFAACERRRQYPPVLRLGLTSFLPKGQGSYQRKASDLSLFLVPFGVDMRGFVPSSCKNGKTGGYTRGSVGLEVGMESMMLWGQRRC